LFCIGLGCSLLVACEFESRASRAARLFREAQQLSASGKYDEALARYQAVAQADPSHPSIAVWSGTAAYAAGRTAQASSLFQGALNRDPTNALAKEGLAALALNQGDAGASLSWLEGPLRARVSFRVLRSRALLARGGSNDAQLAHADAQVARTLDPDCAEGWYLEASALLVLGRYAEAKTAFESVKPALLRSYGLARLAAVQGDKEAALIQLQTARAAADGGWNPTFVRADPAFSFLEGTVGFTEAIGL
jgi:tetratricopeptide (TPR) repeat protein